LAGTFAGASAASGAQWSPSCDSGVCGLVGALTVVIVLLVLIWLWKFR
jgi:hypothetical protein